MEEEREKEWKMADIRVWCNFHNVDPRVSRLREVVDADWNRYTFDENGENTRGRLSDLMILADEDKRDLFCFIGSFFFVHISFLMLLVLQCILYRIL